MVATKTSLNLNMVSLVKVGKLKKDSGLMVFGPNWKKSKNFKYKKLHVYLHLINLI